MSDNARDEETGRFLPGNSFWRARSTAGPKPKFSNPEDLWKACVEYFEWVEANPLYGAKLVSYQGKSTLEAEPKMRAMTVGALCIFLDVGVSTWHEWKNDRPDLAEVIASAEEVIRQQKFAGAAADLLNANIISRDLGLADKAHLDADVKVEETQHSPTEIARRVAFLLASGIQQETD